MCVCARVLWKLGLEDGSHHGAPEPRRGQHCQCPIQIPSVPITSLQHSPTSNCLRILCSCWNRLCQSSQQARNIRTCLLGAALYLQLTGIGEQLSQPLPSGEPSEVPVPALSLPGVPYRLRPHLPTVVTSLIMHAFFFFFFTGAFRDQPQEKVPVLKSLLWGLLQGEPKLRYQEWAQ